MWRSFFISFLYTLSHSSQTPTHVHPIPLSPCSSLHYMPELVKRMNSWSMAGFVYFLCAFMLLKYVGESAGVNVATGVTMGVMIESKSNCIVSKARLNNCKFS